MLVICILMVSSYDGIFEFDCVDPSVSLTNKIMNSLLHLEAMLWKMRDRSLGCVCTLLLVAREMVRIECC